MTVTMFEHCLDRYGAEIAVWPVDLQAAARALRDRSPEARAAHDALTAIEALLRSDRTATTPGLATSGLAMMAARAMQHRQERSISRAARRAGWAVAALAVLVVGLFVGSVGLDHDEGPDHAMASAFDPAGPADVD